MDNYYTPEQLAERLGVTSKTVRGWLRAGDLIGIKVGKSWRIHPADINRLLDEQLFNARRDRARKVHPGTVWVRGQCKACGSLIPVPDKQEHWVCSTACREEHDLKVAAVLDPGTEEYAIASAVVTPPY